MRDLAIRGGPFTADEKTALVGYCESDVLALDKLLPAMLPQIDLPRALYVGDIWRPWLAWNGPEHRLTSRCWPRSGTTGRA